MRTLLLLLALLGALHPADLAGRGDAAGSAGLRIFACTHSFAVYVPEFLGEMAKAAQLRQHKLLGMSRIPGSQVIQHWVVPDEQNKAKQALESGRVEVLTLTPITAPDDGVRLFAKLAFAKNPQVRVAMQESWGPFAVPPYFPIAREYVESTYWPSRNDATLAGLQEKARKGIAELDAMAEGINRELGRQVVVVIPAAQAMIALRGRVAAGAVPGVKNQDALFTDTLGHPGRVARVLVGYCHFAVIYQRSPIGLPVPKWLADQPEPERVNRILQEIAWEAVTAHRLSGVAGAGTP